MDHLYGIGDSTKQELAELETVEVGGINATQQAITLMDETGVDAGELAARYCEWCVRGGLVDLIGFMLDPDRDPQGSGAVCVVLDPETHRITIYIDPH